MISCILGMSAAIFFVLLLFSRLKSIHIFIVPSFFLTKITGKFHNSFVSGQRSITPTSAFSEPLPLVFLFLWSSCINLDHKLDFHRLYSHNADSYPTLLKLSGNSLRSPLYHSRPVFPYLLPEYINFGASPNEQEYVNPTLGRGLTPPFAYDHVVRVEGTCYSCVD